MDKAKILFVYPVPGDLPGEAIDFCEGDLTLHKLPCHVAVFSNGGLLEALPSGVTISSLDKYADVITKVITIDVPNLAAAESWALLQIGRPYSRLSCAEAEIYALSGEQINLPQRGSDCSQLGTDYLRVAGATLFNSEPAAFIRPSDLLAELTK